MAPTKTPKGKALKPLFAFVRGLRFHRRKDPFVGRLKKKLQALKTPDGYRFFESLDRVHPSKNSVRKLVFEGVPIAIKNTRGRPIHGAYPKQIRKGILLHQKAVRSGKIKPQRYRIRTPKVYCRVGKYLVMEFVPDPRYSEIQKGISQKERQLAFDEAKKELISNMRKIGMLNPFIMQPQTLHLMIWGNSNPKHPEKGVFDLAFPYDFE